MPTIYHRSRIEMVSTLPTLRDCGLICSSRKHNLR